MTKCDNIKIETQPVKVEHLYNVDETTGGTTRSRLTKRFRGILADHGLACKLVRFLDKLTTEATGTDGNSQPYAGSPGKVLGAASDQDLCILARVGADGESIELVIRKAG